MKSVRTVLRGLVVAVCVLAGASVTYAQPPLVANAGPATLTMCSNGQVTLGGNPTANGGQGPYSYLWAPATGLSSTTVANPVCTVNTTTTYTITVTDAGGATQTDNINVVVNAAADANLVLQAPAVQTNFNGLVTFSLCDPALSWNFSVDDASTGIPAGSTFSINWGDGSPLYSPASGGWSTTHTYAQGLHTLTYTITSGTCTDTEQFQVFLGTNPGGGISTNPNTNICTGGSLPFFLNNVLTNTPGTTYLIDFGDGTDTLLQQPPPAVINHVYNVSSCPGGSFTVMFTAQNPCDQTNGQISPIRVSQTPVVAFSLSTDTVCVNSVVTATDASLGLQAPQCTQPKHLWSVSPAAGWVLSSGSLGNTNGQPGNPGLWTGGSASLGVQFTAPGSYTITDVVGNVCGFDTLSRSICVEAPPLPAFTLAPNPICQGQQVTTDNTSTSPNSCLTRYQWQVTQTTSYCNSGSTTSFVAGTSATSFEPVILFSSAGVYNVILQAINSCPIVQVTQPVTVVGPPQVSLFPVGPLCAGQSIFPVATFQQCGGVLNTAQWTTTGGSPASVTANSPGGISYANAGNFNVNVSVSNQCGTATATAPLVVNPVAPSANATASPTTLCAGATIQLGANTIPGATYSWTGPNGFTSTLEDPSIPNATVAMSGTYTVTATIGLVCAGPPSSVVVTVNPAPVLTISPNSPSICAGANVSLTANGGSGYTWTANGAPAGVGTTILVNPLTTTTYIVNGAGLGCSGTASTTVTVNPLPVVNAGPDQSLCDQPIGTQLTGVPAGGTWSGSPNVTAAGVFTPNGVGTFTLTYTYTNASNCTAADQVDVVVAPVNAPANAGPNVSVCVGAAAFNLAGVPAGGTWSGSANVSAGGTFTPSTAGTFNLTYTSGSGTCQTSDVAIVTVNPLPVVDAGNAISVCLSAATVALNGTPAGGTWSGTGVTGSTFNPATAGVGSFNLTYTYSNANNCTASDIVSATVNPLPTSNAGPDLNLCNQPIATLLSGLPAGGTWSGPNISAGGNFTPNGVGTFTVYYTVTNASNCTAVDSAVVTVSPVTNPANAGADQSVCVGSANLNLVGLPAGGTWSGIGVTAGGVYTPSTAGTFVLTYAVGSGTCVTQDLMIVTVNALPTVLTPGNDVLCVNWPVVQYIPTLAGGVWSGPVITQAGDFDPAVSGVGVFNLLYTYTDANGCVDDDAMQVTVNPLPVVNAGNDQIYCDQPIPQQLIGTPPGGTWSGPNVSASGLFTPNGLGVSTVTYSYTDGNFCTNEDQADITVIPVVNPANAGADQFVCIGSAAFQLTGLPLGGTWSGSVYVNASGLFDPSVDGVYVLTYSEGSGTCVTQDQVTVTVYALPIVDAGPDVSACFDGGLQTVVGNPAGGTWSGAGITDPLLGLFDPSLTGPGPFGLTYTYTDPFTTCTNSDGTTLTVEPLPVADFGNAPIACVNAPFPFTDQSIGATAWQWDFGDGLGTSNAQNPSYTYADTGVYVVTLIASTSAGCDDTLSTTLTVWEPPTVAFSLAPVNGCGPLPVSFTNNSTGTGVGYAWDFGNGMASVLQNPPSVNYVASAYADTIYTITLTATNLCGSVQAQDIVTVFPTPTAIFGPDLNTGCSPWTPTFSNVTIGQADTYFWDFGDGTTLVSLDSLVQHTYTTGVNDTTFTVTLIATNACGSDTATYDITVQPNTVTAFFNTDTLQGCAPLTVNFTQYSIGSTNWGWDFGDSNVSTQQSPTHTYTSPGTFVVQLFVDNGCSYDTTTQVITVFPSPIVAFDWAPDSVCANEPFQFTNLTANTANIVWTFGDGTGSVLSNPVHTYAGTGTYNVTATVTSSINGCEAALTQSVTVKTTPIAALSPQPNSGCTPVAVQFQNTSTNADFYTWDFGDGNNSGLPAPAHTYGTPGTYVVQLIAQNLNGCVDTAYTQVVAFPVPSAAFTYTPDSSCVSPATVQFSNQSQGAINFAWTFGNNQSSPLNEPSVTYAAPGTYVIQLTAQNAFGCTATATDVFTVYPTPEALFTVEPQPGCDTYPVTFLNNSVNTTGQWWILGDGTFSSDEEPVNIYPGPGLYDVMLVVNGVGGCLDTLAVDDAVLINPSPVAAFSFDTLLTLDNALQFTNGSSGASSYYWDFDDGETSQLFAPLHLFPADGGGRTVCLIAINDLGCPDTTCKFIEVPEDPQIFAPNAFTPDGDGLNDTFLPMLDGYAGSRPRLLIFNRWGEVIYNTLPIIPWDGNYNGVPCKTDVYVWKVIVDDYGDEREFIGHVTLIRGDY